MLAGLRPAISIAGLPRDADQPWGETPRAAIEWVAGLGVRAIVLDATMPGLRPRELDRSARRDLAALLRRRELDLAGLDLWIPPEHLASAEQQDRAVAAVVGAAGLASELARLVGGRSRAVVCLVLPSEGGAVHAIDAGAGREGAALADHGWPGAERWIGAEGAVGVGIDPAGVLMAGAEPSAAASRAGASLRVARLSDLASHGRVAVGARGGRLDVLSFGVALATAGYAGDVVVDLRGLADPVRGARAGLEAFTPGE